MRSCVRHPSKRSSVAFGRGKTAAQARKGQVLPRPAVLTALLLLAVALPANRALAEDARGCAASKWPLDRERTAFATPGLPVVEHGSPLPGIMDPAIVRLKPVAEAGFVRPPGRKPREGSFGATFKTPPLAVGGLYQITLSDAGWIDVIQNGRALRSAGSTVAKDCPSVRRSVRFSFEPGEATVQISGVAADSIKVDLLPPP